MSQQTVRKMLSTPIACCSLCPHAATYEDHITKLYLCREGRFVITPDHWVQNMNHWPPQCPLPNEKPQKW